MSICPEKSLIMYCKNQKNNNYQKSSSKTKEKAKKCHNS